MLFPTPEFVWFFSLVFFLYWYIFRLPDQRKVLLVVANLFFYSLWSYKFTLLLIFVTFYNYYFIIFIQKNKEYITRKFFLIASIVVNICILGFFKYAYAAFDLLFLTAPFCAKSQFLHFMYTASLLLPIGLSYYMFKCMSFVFDVYLKKIRQPASYLDFLLYVSFFPQIISGPIVHASDFLADLSRAIDSDREKTAKPIAFDRATVFILSGLYKKMIVANFLSVLFVEPVFAHLAAYGTIELLFAAIAYAFVIYSDFSGYSDMAIGIALLLGFETPRNFNRPYMAKSITDFWRRWHISFSTWIRNYLYYSLGGSRFGFVRTIIALFFTMLVTGIWHGGRVNFLLWGAVQGFFLVFERSVMFIKNRRPSFKIRNSRTWFKNMQGIFTIAYTFTVTVFSWVIFRAENMSHIALFFTSLRNFHVPIKILNIPIIVLMALGFFLQIPGENFRKKVFFRYASLPFFIKLFLIVMFFLLLNIVSMSGMPPFIYAGF